MSSEYDQGIVKRTAVIFREIVQEIDWEERVSWRVHTVLFQDSDKLLVQSDSVELRRGAFLPW